MTSAISPSAQQWRAGVQVAVAEDPLHTSAMKPLLDAPAVAALLGVSRAAAYREKKRMENVVIGERTLRVTAAVETYVRQRTKDVAPPRRASTGRKSAVAASSPVAPSVNGRPELRVVQPRTRPRAPSPQRAT